jgi:hypothetical protein
MKIEHERKKRGKRRSLKINWITDGHMHCSSEKGGRDDTNTVMEGGV